VYPWRPPIQIEALAELLQVRVFEAAPLAGAKGMLFPGPAGFSIRLSSQVRDGRSFTIAHELGHVLFYDKTNPRPQRRRDLDVDPPTEERICDYIAANLLMPRDLVLRGAISADRLSVADVLLVHRTFGVSVRAAARRLLIDLYQARELLFTKWRGMRHDRLGDLLTLDWTEGLTASSMTGLVAPRASVLYEALAHPGISRGLDRLPLGSRRVTWTQATAWTDREPPVVFGLHQSIPALES